MAKAKKPATKTTANAKKKAVKKSAVGTQSKAASRKAAKKPGQTATTPTEFAVVAFGASAGAVDVLKHTVSLLRPEWNAAYIVALHISPKYASQLVEVLTTNAKVKVVAARNGAQLTPGTVFVVPPNKNLLVDGSKIVLKPAAKGPTPKPSVNVLFTSLAEELGERVVAVILSGTGSDGAQGIRRVKQSGGITIVQNPEFCAYGGMPQAALATSCVDLVSAPEGLGDIVGSVVAPIPTLQLPTEKENLTEQILARMSSVAGVDYSYVKESTLQRRIKRRLAIHGREKVEDYVRRLEAEDSEVQALAQSMLISVTEFFRDPEAFKELRHVLAGVLKRTRPGVPFRVWVPACSTGEEAYSIAIILRELLDGLGRPPEFTVFASDLSAPTIDKARAGAYSADAVEGMPPDMLRRNFTENDGVFRVKDSLRRHTVFSVQNILSDAPFSRIDLVSCRNFLIYVKPRYQERVLDTLAYALNPSGLLFLGRSEQPAATSQAFATVSKEHRIYKKLAPTGMMRPRQVRVPPIAPSLSHPERRVDAARNLFELASATMARSVIPNWLIVDRHDIIKFISDGARSLVRIPSGPAVLRIFDSLIPEIVVDMRGLLFRARREKAMVSGFRTMFNQGGKQMSIKPHVFPIQHDEDELWVVVLDVEPAREDGDAVSRDKGKWDESYVVEVERRYATLQQDMRSMSEELETSNEELQSQSEELHSANEELQSTNEELLTSNEELQSSNEELLTVNEELQSKSNQFAQEAARLNALTALLDQPLLSFDGDLKLVTANEPAKVLFSRTPRFGTAINALPWKHDARRLIDALTAAQESGEPTEVKHGKSPAWQGRSQPVESDTGTRAGVLVVLQRA